MTMHASPPDIDSAPTAAVLTARERHHTAGPDPGTPVGLDAADVYWPDPSPLQHWWTEIMDDALTSRPRGTG